MPPVSTIKRLPPDLRAAIEEQLSQGRTLTEVTAAVRSMGAEVSRSAIGRHKQQLDKILERSRRTRDIAEVLARSAGRGGASRIVRGNAELMHGVLYAAAEAAEQEGGTVSVKDAMMLAIALEKIAKAEALSGKIEQMEADAVSAVVDTEGTPVSAKQIEVVFVDAQPVSAVDTQREG